jgi:putative DNA primase/helicase
MAEPPSKIDIFRARSEARAMLDATAVLPELNLDADPVAVARELAALIAQERDILLNGYMPVRVVAEEGQEPHAIELLPESVRAYAYGICRCIKMVRDKAAEVPLKTDIANLYLNGLEGQWGLKPLRGISTSPLIGSDGSIRSAAGYDEETGLWCHSIPALTIIDRPTRDDAQRALLVLRQAFWTFPFGDANMIFDGTLGVNVVNLSEPAGLDESTHLVALMTSVCRACLSLAPGFLYDAPQFSGAGTGKGLLVKSTSIIGNGRAPAAMTSGHNAEEMDKRLVAIAIEARPVIYLDNFNEGILQSAALASFLTEDPARVRVLGQSKTVPLNTRAFVAITGNAVQIAEDIARRILKIRLDAKMENPEQRPFAAGFLRNVFDRRADLLSAVLTIWRWGAQQGGQLPHGRPLGSYEQWARWCRDPLFALGCRDPVERLSQIKAADPRRQHLAEVFNRWWKHHSDKDVSASDLHLEIKEAIDPGSKRTADDSLVFNRQKVAAFLRAHVNARVGGFALEQGIAARNPKTHNAVATYRLQMEERTP